MMKKLILIITLCFNALFVAAQRGQVHGSEWDDGGSTPIGNFLRFVLVVGGIVWLVKSYIERKKNQ